MATRPNMKRIDGPVFDYSMMIPWRLIARRPISKSTDPELRSPSAWSSSGQQKQVELTVSSLAPDREGVTRYDETRLVFNKQELQKLRDDLATLAEWLDEPYPEDQEV